MEVLGCACAATLKQWLSSAALFRVSAPCSFDAPRRNHPYCSFARLLRLVPGPLRSRADPFLLAAGGLGSRTHHFAGGGGARSEHGRVAPHDLRLSAFVGNGAALLFPHRGRGD